MGLASLGSGLLNESHSSACIWCTAGQHKHSLCCESCCTWLQTDQVPVGGLLDKTYAVRRRKNNFKPDKVRFWSQWLTDTQEFSTAHQIEALQTVTASLWELPQKTKAALDAALKLCDIASSDCSPSRCLAYIRCSRACIDCPPACTDCPHACTNDPRACTDRLRACTDCSCACS